MISGLVPTDGARLYYERRGSGNPLLLIGGGGSGCGYYAALGERMAQRYTVLSYERHGMSGRTLEGPPDRTQRARPSDDAMAVLRTNGFASMLVFGSGDGATITLDLLARCPRAVRAAVVHDPPESTIDYEPDFEQIAAGNAHVALAHGARSDAVAIRMSQTLAESLGVECVQFPGGGLAPLECPDEFGRDLIRLLDRL